MKPIIFDEDQLSNIDEIGQALFQDTSDPTSVSYIRKLNRPKICWFRVFSYILIPILISVVWVIYTAKNNLSVVTVVLPILLFLLLYLTFTLKKAIICAIRIYQRYTPDSIRNKCRFEPSCSEYMILAIQKYGLVSGLRKGFDRLSRCNISGGGFDFP